MRLRLAYGPTAVRSQLPRWLGHRKRPNSNPRFPTCFVFRQAVLSRHMRNEEGFIWARIKRITSPGVRPNCRSIASKVVRSSQAIWITRSMSAGESESVGTRFISWSFWPWYPLIFKAEVPWSSEQLLGRKPQLGGSDNEPPPDRASHVSGASRASIVGYASAVRREGSLLSCHGHGC